MLAVLWLLRFSEVDVCFRLCMADVREGLVVGEAELSCLGRDPDDQAREEEDCPCDSFCCELSWSADCRPGTLPVCGLLSSSDASTTENGVVVVDEEAKLVLHLVSIECRRSVGANTAGEWCCCGGPEEEVDDCDRLLLVVVCCDGSCSINTWPTKACVVAEHVHRTTSTAIQRSTTSSLHDFVV